MKPLKFTLNGRDGNGLIDGMILIPLARGDRPLKEQMWRYVQTQNSNIFDNSTGYGSLKSLPSLEDVLNLSRGPGNLTLSEVPRLFWTNNGRVILLLYF